MRISDEELVKRLSEYRKIPDGRGFVFMPENGSGGEYKALLDLQDARDALATVQRILIMPGKGGTIQAIFETVEAYYYAK